MTNEKKIPSKIQERLEELNRKLFEMNDCLNQQITYLNSQLQRHADFLNNELQSLLDEFGTVDSRFRAGDQTLWNDLPASQRPVFNFTRIRRVCDGDTEK